MFYNAGNMLRRCRGAQDYVQIKSNARDAPHAPSFGGASQSGILVPGYGGGGSSPACSLMPRTHSEHRAAASSSSVSAAVKAWRSSADDILPQLENEYQARVKTPQDSLLPLRWSPACTSRQERQPEAQQRESWQRGIRRGCLCAGLIAIPEAPAPRILDSKREGASIEDQGAARTKVQLATLKSCRAKDGPASGALCRLHQDEETD